MSVPNERGLNCASDGVYIHIGGTDHLIPLDAKQGERLWLAVDSLVACYWLKPFLSLVYLIPMLYLLLHIILYLLDIYWQEAICHGRTDRVNRRGSFAPNNILPKESKLPL